MSLHRTYSMLTLPVLACSCTLGYQSAFMHGTGAMAEPGLLDSQVILDLFPGEHNRLQTLRLFGTPFTVVHADDSNVKATAKYKRFGLVISRVPFGFVITLFGKVPLQQVSGGLSRLPNMSPRSTLSSVLPRYNPPRAGTASIGCQDGHLTPYMNINTAVVLFTSRKPSPQYQVSG